MSRCGLCMCMNRQHGIAAPPQRIRCQQCCQRNVRRAALTDRTSAGSRTSLRLKMSGSQQILSLESAAMAIIAVTEERLRIMTCRRKRTKAFLAGWTCLVRTLPKAGHARLLRTGTSLRKTQMAIDSALSSQQIYTLYQGRNCRTVQRRCVVCNQLAARGSPPGPRV